MLVCVFYSRQVVPRGTIGQCITVCFINFTPSDYWPVYFCVFIGVELYAEGLLASMTSNDVVLPTDDDFEDFQSAETFKAADASTLDQSVLFVVLHFETAEFTVRSLLAVCTSRCLCV